MFLCPVFFSFFLHTSVNGFFLSKHGYVVSENVGDEGGFFFFFSRFFILFSAYALVYRCTVFPRSVIDYSRSLSDGGSESIVTWKELLKVERFLHCSFQCASVGGRSQLCESQGCGNGYRRQEPGNLLFNCSTSR